MSWNYDIWSQQSDSNFGYPYITDAGLSDGFNWQNSPVIWNMNMVLDYPGMKIGEADPVDPYSFYSVWQLNPKINFGYPYIKELFPDTEWGLWSINKDNKDLIVSDSFPYAGEAGIDGNFIAMIRSKFSANVERQLDSSLNISFNLELEDAVRKSVGETTCAIGNLTCDFNSFDSESSPSYQAKNLSSGSSSILSDKKIVRGYYQGEVASYYSGSNPNFSITIRTKWLDKTENAETYSANIVCEDVTSKEKWKWHVSSSNNTTFTFTNLTKFDLNGNIAKYIIYEETDTNFPWSIEITNSEITYNSENKTATVENRWNNFAAISNVNIIEKTFTTYTEEVNKRQNEIILTNWNGELRNGLRYASAQDSEREWTFRSTYLLSSAAENDWSNFVKESQAYLELPTKNASAIFCAHYSWRQYYMLNGLQSSEWYTLIPFITIVTRDSNGIEQFYSFSTHIDNFGDGAIAAKLNEIAFPYISHRVNNNTANHVMGIGTQSTAQQWRWGAKENFNTQLSLDELPYQGAIIYTGGSSALPLSSPFFYTLGEITYEGVKIKNNNGKISLRNFCIYITDKACADSKNIGDIVPYYYVVSVKTPASQNSFGTLNITTMVNIKNDNFISGTTTLSDFMGDYPYHTWTNTIDNSDETSANYHPYVDIAALNNGQFILNKQKMDEDLESGILHDYIYDEDENEIYNFLTDQGSIDN